MKKLSVFVFIAILFLSCKNQKAPGFAVISGKILNSNSDKITLDNLYDYDDFRDISLTKSEEFRDTITLDWNHGYSIYENNNEVFLYLSKGDNLTIEYDSKKMDSTLVISGIGSEINHYIFEKGKLRGDPIELFKKDEVEFKQSIASLKEEMLKLLASKTNLEYEFIVREKNNIKYEYLNYIRRYLTYHGYYTDNRTFKPSEGFADELKTIEHDNENDFKFSPSYRTLIDYYFKEEVSKNADTLVDPDIRLLNLYATIKSDLIKNKLLFDDAQTRILYTNNLDEYYKKFIQVSTNESYNEKITKSYNALKLVGKGYSSPKFIDYENNAGGTSTLDDFKGKYLYIDVWATWCGPCRAEISSLKQVEKQYQGRNIEFISISIDDQKDHAKWKRMIIDEKLGGIQLFADNSWESKFIKDYMIQGIPGFILIDPSGNIVNSNAPRPSNKDLIALFDELNI